MWKKILLVLIVLLLTGCVKIDSDNNDYISVINGSLSKNKISNNVGIGYKFYVPRGVKLIKNYDYNQSFLVGDDYIYLYVDIISYYYRSKLNYNAKTSDNIYYNNNISFDDKVGFISIIDKKNDNYYVKIVYNYARVEFFTDKNNLNKMIGISSAILNNIDYNDLIIKNVLDNNYGNYKEIKYKVDKPEDAGSNFSQFLEEYIKEDDVENLPDE